MALEILKSGTDDSVNFIKRLRDGSIYESRYVRRCPEYFITYLSSQAGCNKACRMCHLTQTGQTDMTDASFAVYLLQLAPVLEHYDSLNLPAQRMNVNFMARGDPFANRNILDRFYILRHAFDWNTAKRNLTTQYNFSTIMPEEVRDISLDRIFRRADHDTREYDVSNIMIYYSLYSMREQFRKRWLPKALDPNIALDKLAEYQCKTGGEVALHWAFIEGQNDDLETLEEIVEAVESRELTVKFNLVRYNPFSPAQGKEPTEAVLQRNFDYMRNAFDDELGRIVPRVGFDAKVSCGMFVER